MAIYHTPHTPDWFKALGAFNPMQAAQTQQMVTMAGSDEVCSVCGDDPAADYQIVANSLPANAVATIRLCDDCLGIRTAAGEHYAPFP